MEITACVSNLIVTTQADIDHGSLSLCPNIAASIDIRNATGTLTFPNITATDYIYVRDSPRLDDLYFNQLFSASRLEIDHATNQSYVSLPKLSYLEVLNFTGAPLSTNVVYQLFDLASVVNLTLKGIRPGRILYSTALQVNETMILESSGQGELSNLLDNDIAMGVIGQIGQDLIINSNSNVRIMYDGLRDVGGSLSISNNTNCTFDFSQISTAGSLLITDNTNTTVPLFPYLSRAESIYIHGLIDTSTGPNIFPALEFVSGNVTIEALNDDFDCSKLISQFKEDIIHNLKCNGQNNETIAPEQRLGNGTSTPIPTQNPSFSPGAWAGIGIGAGVAVIGIFGAFIWIIIHYRSRLRKLERKAVRDSDEKLSTGEPEQPQVFQMQEVDGRGIFREKPDDPLVEMHTQPAELPTRPQSWAESEEGDISLAK